jgi:hypothetical protein
MRFEDTTLLFLVLYLTSPALYRENVGTLSIAIERERKTLWQRAETG